MICLRLKLTSTGIPLQTSLQSKPQDFCDLSTITPLIPLPFTYNLHHISFFPIHHRILKSTQQQHESTSQQHNLKKKWRNIIQKKTKNPSLHIVTVSSFPSPLFPSMFFIRQISSEDHLLPSPSSKLHHSTTGLSLSPVYPDPVPITISSHAFCWFCVPCVF